MKIKMEEKHIKQGKRSLDQSPVTIALREFFPGVTMKLNRGSMVHRWEIRVYTAADRLIDEVILFDLDQPLDRYFRGAEISPQEINWTGRDWSDISEIRAAQERIAASDAVVV